MSQHHETVSFKPWFSLDKNEGNDAHQRVLKAYIDAAHEQLRLQALQQQKRAVIKVAAVSRGLETALQKTQDAEHQGLI